MKIPYIIGIAGGSGSGKTFFADALASKIGSDKALLIRQDNYYIDQSAHFDQDGGAVNFDHPSAIDFDLLAKHLKELKNLKDISIPQYDFKTHTRSKETIKASPRPVVLIDGILILTNEKLKELFDDTVFIDTPEEIRFERRLERDVATRGRTKEGVQSQIKNQVKPMHDFFVEPCKEGATFVNSGTDMEAFNKLQDFLINKIKNLI